MKKGYVIFENEAAFNAAHQEAKNQVGLAKVGQLMGQPAPNKQWCIEITECTKHPSNETVVAYINGGWPDDLKEGFIFLTEEQVSEYFPEY